MKRCSCFLVVICCPLLAQSPRYESHQDHDPDGSGKFYMGREIALVMGHEAAGWLDRPERETEEKTSRLLELLAIKPGQVVADIGAGSGYHSLRISKLVGDKGKVLAVDIQQEMLDIIADKASRLKLTNIDRVLGKEDDPKLPKDVVDLVILVDVYHEFSFPYEMMRGIVDGIKPKGRVAFVEFRAEDERVPIKRVHKMSERQVVREMEPFPLKHLKTLGELPWQHVILFEKWETPKP